MNRVVCREAHSAWCQTVSDTCYVVVVDPHKEPGPRIWFNDGKGGARVGTRVSAGIEGASALTRVDVPMSIHSRKSAISHRPGGEQCTAGQA